MVKTIILRGLPAGGKSFYALDYCEKNPNTVRVNRDSLRRMRGKYLIPEQECMITSWERSCIEHALKAGKDVIVDNMHLKQLYVNELVELCTKYGDVETKVFNTDVELCVRRDRARVEWVGEDVIRGFAKRFDISRMKNEFFPKKQKEPATLLKQNDSLPDCILVDLDNTLCLHDGRGPFEYDKCDTDNPNKPILNLVNQFRETPINLKSRYILFVSGREATPVCVEKTIAWLKRYTGLRVTLGKNLFMRPEGDYRKDAVVKKELFDNNIRDKYYVEFVLDDRKQVVDMWRSLGLTCLQVADGDF